MSACRAMGNSGYLIANQRQDKKTRLCIIRVNFVAYVQSYRLCVMSCIVCSQGHPRVTFVSEYKNLQNQPLKFVLAEFRFSSAMQIADYISKLQGALQNRYPIFEKTGEHSVQIQSGNITVSALHRWSFVSENKKTPLLSTMNDSCMSRQNTQGSMASLMPVRRPSIHW